MSENYKFFQNKSCEYFPCHKIENEEEFNCLFCYCPLFLLKTECGGDFANADGIKDCSNCIKPHNKNSYSFIMEKMKLVYEKGKL